MQRRVWLVGLMAVTATLRGEGTTAPAADAPRERLLMDFDWKFYLGDDWGPDDSLAKARLNDGPAATSFHDQDWRTLNLPHDWAVELPFDHKANYDHGYKPLGPGYPSNSIAWYRKTFTLPAADQGRRLWLEFDGVYRNCRVFLNGFRITHHESGYNSFRCDITDVAKVGGKNVLAVRVDASEFEGWFYEGAGIYRHVWLVKTSPLAVAPDGIFVYSTFPNNVPQGPATIHLQTRLGNWGTNSLTAKVNWQILAPGGEMVASANAAATLNAGGKTQVESTAKVTSPVLWSPESPKLYQLVTTIVSNERTVDCEKTDFGIRTIAFDPDQGFLLNGRHYEIKGTCNHQDHAGVGSALPDALQYFRVEQLKKMGCNAIRTSHNEPTSELLDACDRLGLLVMDENREMGSDSRNLANLRQQVLRDRNHPSVFVWSLCNEEYVQQEAVGARIYETMQNLVHQLDQTRLCTAAMNGWSSGKPTGISTVMDVQGFNYLNNGDMDGFHRSNPNKPCIGTEEASAFYTRGVYENSKTYDSAYDANKPSYGATAEEWWKYYSARPWASGAFVWTGFDYRGEASPFHWPNISSEFGILDTCGFPKDAFYYYQSWWTTNVVLHLLPHWNGSTFRNSSATEDEPGEEGQNVDVWCFSNCRQVELLLNGRSLGKKEMPRNSHLEWNVKYEPGTLSAKGYDADGNVVFETKEETTGVPAGIRLIPDRDVINADGEDCSVVKVEVTDAQERTVPTADNLIHFEIGGPGKIIGVGNGDPACHEPDVYFEQPSCQTLTLNGWRMKKISNPRDESDVVADLDDRQWPKVDVTADDGPMAPGETAVYRTELRLTEAELAMKRLELNLGRVDDQGWVYVNGQQIGEAHVWENDPLFDIRQFVHVGGNSIAVVVKNNGGPGGISRGAKLELEKAPPPLDWQRSVFNGLAEVLVQANRHAGEIKLTARAKGLAPTTFVIYTRPDSDSRAAP